MPTAVRRIREQLRSAAVDHPSTGEVFRAADLVVRPAMHAHGMVWSTVDPATVLNTSCHFLADIGDGQFEIPPDEAARRRERRLFELEWLDHDPHTWADLLRRGRVAAGLRRSHDPDAVVRFRELIAPSGVHDELRVVCAADAVVWATAIAYRLDGEPFDERDERLAATWAPLVARDVRRAMLRSVCDAPWMPEPPGVVELDGCGEAVACSTAAAALLGDPTGATAATALAAVWSRARGDAAATVQTEIEGRPVRLHASPVVVDGRAGDHVSVVVERPLRAQLAALVIESFELTARERDVTELTLAGYGRKQIAGKLGISPDTLSTHLGAIFRKAGVDSRAGLCELVYGTYYEDLRERRAVPSPLGHFVPGG